MPDMMYGKKSMQDPFAGVGSSKSAMNGPIKPEMGLKSKVEAITVKLEGLLAELKAISSVPESNSGEFNE